MILSVGQMNHILDFLAIDAQEAQTMKQASWGV
jgi:hypothetical protein